MSQAKTSKPVIVSSSEEKLELKNYLIGYGVSLALTLTAYLSVYHHLASTNVLVVLVAVLAISQFLVQIFFFLHLGKETKPRWRLYVFILMVTIVLILVIGSIWIIDNLNSRMTLPQQTQYMNRQDGL